MLGGRVCAYMWSGAPCRQAVVLASNHNTLSFVFSCFCPESTLTIFGPYEQKQTVDVQTKDPHVTVHVGLKPPVLIKIPLHQQLFPIKRQEY